MKKEIHELMDGYIAISETPPGHSVEITEQRIGSQNVHHASKREAQRQDIELLKDAHITEVRYNQNSTILVKDKDMITPKKESK